MGETGWRTPTRSYIRADSLVWRLPFRRRERRSASAEAAEASLRR